MSVMDMMAAMARDAVTTQRRLDEYAVAARVRFEQELGQMPPLQAALMAPLAPTALVASTFRFSCRARVEVGWSAGVSIAARPINIGYELIHQASRSREATFTVEVVQVPAGSAVDVPG